jgi:hypothetical protein
VQIELLRAAGTEGRAARAFALSELVISLARAAIRERHPELPESEILLRFAQIHYGHELAQAVRRRLESA